MLRNFLSLLVLRNFFVLLVAMCMTSCVTAPTGEKQLSQTGKVAIQELAGIALDRYIRTHQDRASSIVKNVRRIATELRDVTTATTVTGLRAAVDIELTKLNLNPEDLQDATRVLNIFEALLHDQIGSDAIDGQALIKVRDFLNMITGALPAV